MTNYLNKIHSILDWYKDSITTSWDISDMTDEQWFDLFDTEIDPFRYAEKHKAMRFSVKEKLYDTLYLRNNDIPSVLYYKEQSEEEHYYSHVDDWIKNKEIILGLKPQSDSKPLYRVWLLKDTYKIHIPYNESVYNALQALDENPMWPWYTAFMISKTQWYARKEYEIWWHVSHSFYVLQKATEQQLEIILNALLEK